MELVRPTLEHLDSYRRALIRELGAGTAPYPDEAENQLHEIETDPEFFLAKQEDRQALGGDVKLPDGTYVPRLPNISRFMWDGEACGRINFRWQDGSTDLPPECLGHIGYDVFTWKRNKGYASDALKQILPEAVALGMPFVELTTNLDNYFSQRVIQKNGGVLHEKFVKPASRGGGENLRFRIYL
jgi:predicted acetyltransferase